jgi:hypothetical protein
LTVPAFSHVSNDDEAIALAYLFEHSEKQVATVWCAKKGMTLITAASNEVKVSGAVKTLGLAVHNNKVEERDGGRGDGGHLPAVTKLAFGKVPFSKSARRGAPRCVWFQL